MAQTVKNLPAMQETRMQSLGWDNLLEKGMVTHPSILAWRIIWTEEPGSLQSMGVAKSQTQLSNQHTHSAKLGIIRDYLCKEKSSNVNSIY